MNLARSIALGVTFMISRSPSAYAQVLSDPAVHRVIALEDADYCEHGPWNLVFEDEFNGDSLDLDHWIRFFPYCSNQDNCEASRVHSFPTEMQIFMDENVELSGEGTVRMTARKGPLRQWYSAESVYTSGMIHSRMQFGKGRFECRCKLPKSTANYLWSAFWLFGGGPQCSEIDIMEILWKRPNSYHHSLHRYNYNCVGNYASDEDGHEMPALWDDFHVFRADWDTWFVNFYVDDILIYRSCRIYDMLARPVSNCHVPAGIYMQNQAFPGQDADMSIILGLALHNSPFVDELGNGLPIPDLPAVMEVDYVRVYQRDP